VGIISCEKTGTIREWQPQEQSFVLSVANLVSLALESEALQNEVAHLLDVVSAVEEGNLKVRASVSDKATGLVSDTLNRLIEELAEVIQQVLATAKQVSNGSLKLEEIAFAVTNGAQQQAEAVTQVLTLSEQVETSATDSAIQVQATKQSLIDFSPL
jgi:twitching motility protein PilJ